jgi:hypothetical protein
MKKTIISQKGVASCFLVGIFILVGLLVVNLAIAAGISSADYRAAGERESGGADLYISSPKGPISIENVAVDGSYINGDENNHYIPCLKQFKSGFCGCTSAAEIIMGYTGEYIKPTNLTYWQGGNRPWGAELAKKVPGTWAQKTSYKSDGMASIIQTIRGGDAVIIYTKFPKHNGEGGTMHIMAATQFDEDKDAFLVHNSSLNNCKVQWVSRSFFTSNPHDRNGYAWRAP